MQNLSGLQKAVILLITLGTETSAKVIRCLSEAEIDQVTAEMANVNKIPAEIRQEVLKEFEELFHAHGLFLSGGLDYAKEVLDRALGNQKAMEIIGRLVQNSSVRPFEFVRKADPKHLTASIQGEHPQTIALILAHLLPERAAMVLSALPQDVQPEVAKRIALMGQVNPEIVREIEEVLKRKFANFSTGATANVGGVKTIVEVLNRVDHGTVKTVMSMLETNEPELAETIKGQMFVF